MVASPRLRAPWSVSLMSTGIPAFANTMAMPPPIVPAPTTAADFMGITAMSLGMSGILLVSRSLKKTWMSDLDCSEERHSRKSFCSTLQPSSNCSLVDASTASIAAAGASRPRCFLAVASRVEEKICAFSVALPSFSLRWRVFGAGLFATSRANATASARASPSMIRSTIPNFKASSALIGFPVAHISTAFATPESRGRRCVPPAPGISPSCTSGWPSCAPATATR